jgi:release factor glutamine methyltransferase
MSSRREPWTVMEVLGWTSAYFQEKDVLDPRASAEVLLAHALGINRLDLYLRHDQPLTPQELARFRALVKRRAAGEPTAYLTGHKEFWSLDFKVTPAVLIPRPETEVLVQAVLEVLRGRGQVPKAPVPPLETAFSNSPWGLEIGVGSGAVVTVLAKELPDMIWAAVDLSLAALKVAQDNSRHHQVAGCIHFLQGNLFSGLKPAPRFALIAANLPYVSETEWQTLPRDIREYEPQEALLGGKDGLALLKPLAREAHHYLMSGGWLALEVGLGQAQILREELRNVGVYDRLELVQDYRGIDRVVRARRREAP